jgi:hypothetical protein
MVTNRWLNKISKYEQENGKKLCSQNQIISFNRKSIVSGLTENNETKKYEPPADDTRRN